MNYKRIYIAVMMALYGDRKDPDAAVDVHWY
jgi:hypothetical protein